MPQLPSSSGVPLRRTDPRRVFLVSCPGWLRLPALGPRKREFLVYFAGALFAFGWWAFLDASISSAHAQPISDPDTPYDPVPVRVTFADWAPGLCATLGMVIVNLIDKARLMSDDWDGSWSGGGVAWRARLFLFVGFALMAGGLAGSITVLVIKYIIPHYPENYGVNWGVANVLQSIAIMFSAVVLWTAQNAESDYDYNITL
ncbi:Vacuolar protein sorting-associated protein 68 [Rhodotorula kratochvilovae]